MIFQPPICRPAGRPGHPGLSLLELLITIALSAVIVIAASFMLHSMTRLYFNLESEPLLHQHADGVASLVQHLGQLAEPPTGRGARTFAWRSAPGNNQPTLAFTLDQELPFLVGDHLLTPRLEAFLIHQEEHQRLWLGWRPLPENREDRPAMRYTLLSPWVESIEYGRYDEGAREWVFSAADQMSRGDRQNPPHRIILTFSRGGQRAVRELDNPLPSTGALLY